MTIWMIFFAVLAVGAFAIAAVQGFPQPELRQARTPTPGSALKRARSRRAMRVPEDRC